MDAGSNRKNHFRYILGIETSCDETAAAVVKDGYQVLSNRVSSQTDVHALYGGVVPEIASREHLKLLLPLVDKALEEAGIAYSDLDAVAVTQGPGLVGPLLVGVSFAKGLAYAMDLPLVPVNHTRAHLYANFLVDAHLQEKDGHAGVPYDPQPVPPHDPKHSLQPDPQAGIPFPLISLVASGGHTSIFYLYSHFEWELVGKTRDDACGESFDKIARALNLGYPGGPVIEKEARKGSPTIDFPLPIIKGSYDFSFSGLKSAVLNDINQKRMKGESLNIPDICASFQSAAVKGLVENTLRAAQDKQVHTLLLAGGVSANRTLRQAFLERNHKFAIKFPPLKYCTDNAAMIAARGYEDLRRGTQAGLDLNAVPNL